MIRMKIKIPLLSKLFLCGLLFSLPVQAIPQKKALLGVLDKITGRVHTLEVAVGQTVQFGTLEIEVLHSDRPPAEQVPESTVFLRIFEVSEGRRILFSNWMFASNPSVCTLEHPIYDVWVQMGRSVKEEPPSLSKVG